MMLLLSSSQALPVAFFLANIFSIAAAELFQDVCDRDTYGFPHYSACVSLLYGDGRGRSRGIFGIDNKDHAFFLPYFAGSGPFTIAQWRNRIELPLVWENRTSSCLFFYFLFFSFLFFSFLFFSFLFFPLTSLGHSISS